MPNAESSIWIELLKLSQEAPIEQSILTFAMVFLLVGLATGNGKRIFDALWNIFTFPKIIFIRIYKLRVRKKIKEKKHEEPNKRHIRFSEIEIPNKQKIHMYRVPEIFIITDADVRDNIGSATYKLSHMALNDTKRTYMMLDFTDCQEINDNADLLVREIIDILTFTIAVRLVIIFDKNVLMDQETKQNKNMKKYMKDLEELRAQHRTDFKQDPTWLIETTETNFWEII